jgi:hypothetical protein
MEGRVNGQGLDKEITVPIYKNGQINCNAKITEEYH